MAHEHYDGFILFSGGLDSILAAKVLQEQNLRVLGLHYVTPFFGSPERLPAWEQTYGVPLQAVDAGQAFVDMLARGPESGFGKILNPCVDCKILLLQLAKAQLAAYGARFVATGEVLGQRPMSQRADTLQAIRKKAGVEDLLLRPLSAQLLPSTAVEHEGLVDRERLLALRGRGRKEQQRLAEYYGITSIPQPAGGCLLTEAESAKRYWPLLQHDPPPPAAAFALANLGRQFWAGSRWLCVGRNQQDNTALAEAVGKEDIVVKLKDLPGPLGVARPLPGAQWDETAIRSAAALTASFSGKARKHEGMLTVLVSAAGQTQEWEISLEQAQALPWQEPAWQDVHKASLNQGS